MVHGQGDTDHGAANPLPRKDGSSEPPERAWRNPTTRPQGSPPAMALGNVRDQPCSQPKPGLILMTSGAGHLHSHGSQVRGWKSFAAQPHTALTNLSPSGAAPTIASQHSSSGLGLSHRSTNWWRGRAARLYSSLLCSPAAVLAMLTCCHRVCYQGVPSAPQRGNEGGCRDTPRHWEQPGNTRRRSITLLQTLSLGKKTPVPIHGRLGWACLSARIQPRAKRSTSILLLPPVTGRGSRNSAAANRSLERDGAVGFLLLLVWLLPGLCHSLAHPSKMQSTQQGCAWGWLGRRRLLKTEDSTAGSSGTRREQQQVSSTIPANPQLPQGCFVQLQIPFLSSWMNSLPKAHWICVDKAIYHQHRWVPVKVADQSSDATDFRKNTASLTRQHCDTALPALTVHPRMHPSPVQHPLSSCPNAGTSLRTASEVPFGE